MASKEKGFFNINNNKFGNRFIEILMGITILLTLVNVIIRYIFGVSLNWSGEISRFIFIWLSFIAGSLLVTRDEHLGIGDTFISKLPGNMKNIIIIIQDILSLLFIYFLIKYGYNMIDLLMVRSSTVLNIKMGYIISIIFVSGIFFLINIIDDIIIAIKEMNSNNNI